MRILLKQTKNFLKFQLRENYQNVAELNFIYNLNFWDLYFAPELGSHNDSFIGITLFDTFGDYYKVNINSSDHYFQYYKLNFFDGKTVGENFEYGLFLREHLSLLFALIFYVSLYFYYSKNENIKIYLLTSNRVYDITLKFTWIPR